MTLVSTVTFKEEHMKKKKENGLSYGSRYKIDIKKTRSQLERRFNMRT